MMSYSGMPPVTNPYTSDNLSYTPTNAAPSFTPKVESSGPGVRNLAAVTKELLSKIKMCRGEVTVMEKCLDALSRIARDIGKGWKIGTFGSAATGFYTTFSDLDVTCYQTGSKGRLSARDSIAQVHPLIQAHPAFEVVEVIS